jgi:glutamate racemase
MHAGTTVRTPERTPLDYVASMRGGSAAAALSCAARAPQAHSLNERRTLRAEPPAHARTAPIGVFDSGVGGLTVLRALRHVLPSEQYVYLGDTARLPYGTKSADTVRRYALQAGAVLESQGVKCLVVACNTASSVAIEAMTARFAPLPVLGVVEPGAEAACAASRNGRIAVIATEGTVRGGAYEAAIRRRHPGARVVSRACPLFVALAEEGWTDGPVRRPAR